MTFKLIGSELVGQPEMEKRLSRKKSPGWSTWKAMKQRCYFPWAKDYKWYGAKGIKMSDEFLNDFYAFSDYLKTLDGFDEWMKNKEGSEEITLDRIDNKKGYERGNLRFANWEMQNRNKGTRKDNTSGFPCVTWRKELNMFCAKVRVNRRYVYLGNYQTAEQANDVIIDYKTKNGLL